MARLALTAQKLPGCYLSTPVGANTLDVLYTAAGASFADGAGFVITGKEILLVWNPDASAHNVTINSVEDNEKRKGDITSYSIGADETMMFGPVQTEGWKQPADGKLYFAADNALVKFAVLQIP